jgi:hypothetical protein
MVSQAADVRCALVLDRLQDFLERRIIAAPKHEILPDKNAELITDIVEYVLFPDTTSPYPVLYLAKIHKAIVKDA